MPKDLVIIYTDGACSPNPGTGGWGAVLISNKHNLRTEISGSEIDSTNNRMEMTAAIKALEALKKPCKVELYTDSSYVKNAFEKNWLRNWQNNGWKSTG
jgi:ribonuclease HI